jgi:hypothetical protein
MSRELKSVLNHSISCKPAAEQAVGITDVANTAAAAAAAATTTGLLIHSEFCWSTDKETNHTEAHVRNSIHRDLGAKRAVLGQRLQYFKFRISYPAF